MPKLIKMKDIPERILKINEENIKNIPKLGDIFTFSINEGEFMFGRIIYIGPTAYWSMGGTGKEKIIYYFYNVKSDKKYLDDFNKLSLNNLLTGPIISYKDYFQLGYFEIIGNEEINNKNVHFPICFETKHLVKDIYRDQDDNIIEKQNICGFAASYNIFGIQYDILTALGEPIPKRKENKDKFNLFETNTGFDFSGEIDKNTSLEDLYKKIDVKDYFNKNYDFDSNDELEVLVSIELLISISLEEPLELDKEIFKGIHEFYEINKGKKVSRDIFEKSKLLLDLILTGKNSELKSLRKESGKLTYLRHWIKIRIYKIENILNNLEKVSEKKKFFGLF